MVLPPISYEMSNVAISDGIPKRRHDSRSRDLSTLSKARLMSQEEKKMEEHVSAASSSALIC